MNKSSKNALCMVFSPHQDDVALGCGGTVVKKTRCGQDVAIVYMTDGRNSHLLNFGIKDKPSPDELSLKRAKEEKEAMKTLGVPEENLFFLNIEDGVLYKHRRKAKLAIVPLLRQLNPSEVFIPFHGDKHQDHVATYLIASECLGELEASPTVYQYFVWANPKNFDFKRFKLVAEDITEELELKNQAISKYQTQITKFSIFQAKPVLDGQFLHRFETEKQEVFIVSPSIDRHSVEFRFLSFKTLLCSNLVAAAILLRRNP